jgi:pyochelin biosynthetic protein PchC
MTPADADRWLRARRPLAAPRVRLLAFPYAGGSASVYHAWADLVPPGVEVRAVHLPARQDRLAERPVLRIADIVERVTAALAAMPAAPLVLYGHSFGAVVAFELARHLEARGAPPRALIVGGRRPPHLPPRTPILHDLPEPDFVRALVERYGTLREILDDRDLRELTLPSLRADFEALETHQHSGSTAVPIAVLRGTRDPLLDADEAVRWAEVTTGPSTVAELDADHFFVNTHRAWVVQRVLPYLAAS